MFKFLLNLFAILGLLSGFSQTVLAKSNSDQKLLGTFGHWSAYRFENNQQPVCYMSQSLVTSSSLKTHKKKPYGESRLTVTQRPTEGSFNVVSYSAGYIFKAGSNVNVQIGSASYNLFTVKNTAWARDAALDRTIIRAIRLNHSLTVIGTPATKKASPIKETFELDGAEAAYRAINKSCKVETDPLPQPQNKKKTSKATNNGTKY